MLGTPQAQPAMRQAVTIATRTLTSCIYCVYEGLSKPLLKRHGNGLEDDPPWPINPLKEELDEM